MNNDDADAGAGAWPSVLAGVPRRAGQGGRDPEGGVGVPGGVEAPRVTAGSFRRAAGHRRRADRGALTSSNAVPVPSRKPPRLTPRERGGPVRRADEIMLDRRSVPIRAVTPAVGLIVWVLRPTGRCQAQARAVQLPPARRRPSPTCTAAFRRDRSPVGTGAGVHQSRARAYNGTCNQLVTEENVSSYLPNYAEYKAAVDGDRDAARRRSAQDAADRVRPDGADRLRPGRAAAVRHDRRHSATPVSCARSACSTSAASARSPARATFDRHPSEGPLPAGAPAVCEEFRKQPDALERAAELDAQYGRNPDLAAMPMYCIPFSFKDPYRHQGHAIDRRRRRPLRHGLPGARPDAGRAAARARARSSTPRPTPPNTTAAAGNPGGKNFPTKVLPSTLGYQRSTWAGNPVQCRTTRRAPPRSDRAPARASRSAPTSRCAACARRRAQSCRGPANHNSVALILPHKALLSFHGGAIGSNHLQRPRRHSLPQRRRFGEGARRAEGSGERLLRSARHLHDRAAVERLDRAAMPMRSPPGRRARCKGMRIGIIREFMVKHAKVDEPIVDAAAAGDEGRCSASISGATLVESVPAGWVGRPGGREHDDLLRPGDRRSSRRCSCRSCSTA